jgi:predicted site-specific integrase-resolvase
LPFLLIYCILCAEIEKIVGTLNGRLMVLYGRVSGHGQKADLDTQLERLRVFAQTERKGAEILVRISMWGVVSKPRVGTYNGC